MISMNSLLSEAHFKVIIKIEGMNADAQRDERINKLIYNALHEAKFVLMEMQMGRKEFF